MDFAGDKRDVPIASRATKGVMAARRVESGENPSEGATSARASWSHCEAALTESRITVAAFDPEGRYIWIFNPPGEFPTEVLGKADTDLLPGEAARRLVEAKASVFASGETQEFEIELTDGRGPRWFDVRIRAQRFEGKTVGTVATLIDVTDRKIQEEHLRIVLRELAHRSKNLLAVIQGIARQTAESAQTTQQFVSRFNGRIFSLSRAHDVLTEADWRGARIFDLVRSQVALYAENRLISLTLEGENGFLRPNAAQYVGLALHELTTNALKYGALSRDDGKIVVRLETSAGDATYRFSWKESSTAEPRPPKGRSFGLIMLTEVVPTSVSGTADLAFEPDGLHYRLELPKTQLVA